MPKTTGPELCKHNSGAARQYAGKPIPRGPKTFVETRDADFSKSKVQEVVFRAFVDLPAMTEVCPRFLGGTVETVVPRT